MKLVLRIFNIILIALSVAAISVISFTPLFKAHISYTLDATKISEVFKGKLDTDGDKKDDVNVEEIVGDKSIVVDLNINLNSEKMKYYKTASKEDRINRLYEDVFNPVIKDVVEDETLKGIVKNLATQMAEKAASKSIKESIRDHIVNPENKETFINDVFGGEEEYNEFVDTQVKTVINALTNEDESQRTVDNVVDSIISVMKAADQKFVDAANSEDPEIAAEYASYAGGISDEEYNDKHDAIEDTITATLEEYHLLGTDGETILDIDQALALIVDKMLNPDSSSSSSSSSSIVLRHYASTGDSERSLTDVVTDAVKNMINTTLLKDEGTTSTISDVLGYIGTYGIYVEIAFIVMWAVLAVFALLKIFFPKKPYVYMGFGWWIAIVFFGLIELVFGALLFVNPILKAVGKAITLPEMLGAFGFELYSSLSVVWILNTVLFFFSIAYAIIGHKVKKQNKIEKRASKAAANA